MLRKVLVIVAALLVSTAFARVDVQCKVDGVQRSVQFMTGSELNSATRSFNFRSYKVYALLWYSQDQVAIYEHATSSIGISGTFDSRDLESLYRIGFSERFSLTNGSGSRTVSIECKSFGGWIDPRMR